MSLFSRVFRKSRPKPESFVIRWTQQRTIDLQAQKEITPEVMSAAFLNYLSTFATPSSHAGENDHGGARAAEVEAHFANDSALFELGCYMFGCVAGWLITEHPDLAEPVAQFFADKFVQVFRQALQIDNLRDLFVQRTSMYREFIRSGDDEEKARYHLTELIWKTYDNQKPKLYDPAHQPMLLRNAKDDLFLKIHVLSWISGLVSMLEGFDGNSDLWDSLARSVAKQGKDGDAVGVSKGVDETDIEARILPTPPTFAKSLIAATDKSYGKFQDIDDEFRWATSARLGSEFLLSFLAEAGAIRMALCVDEGFSKELEKSVGILRQERTFQDMDDQSRWAISACTGCAFTYGRLAGAKVLPKRLSLSEDQGARFFGEVANEIDRILGQRKQGCR
jgi:hypothetical protein